MEPRLTSNGYTIRRVREILGIKQEVLALKLEVSQQRISAIEKQECIGEPITKQIANALQIPVNTLIGFDEKKVRQLFTEEEHKNNSITKSSDQASYNYKYDFNRFIDEIIPLYEKLIFLEEKRKDIIIKTVIGLGRRDSFDSMNELLSSQDESLNIKLKKLLDILNISLEEVSRRSRISIDEIKGLEYDDNQSFEILFKISNSINVPIFLLHNSIAIDRDRISILKNLLNIEGSEFNLKDSYSKGLFNIDDIIQTLKERNLILEEEIDRLSFSA